MENLIIHIFDPNFTLSCTYHDKIFKLNKNTLTRVIDKNNEFSKKCSNEPGKLREYIIEKTNIIIKRVANTLNLHDDYTIDIMFTDNEITKKGEYYLWIQDNFIRDSHESMVYNMMKIALKDENFTGKYVCIDGPLCEKMTMVDYVEGEPTGKYECSFYKRNELVSEHLYEHAGEDLKNVLMNERYCKPYISFTIKNGVLDGPAFIDYYKIFQNQEIIRRPMPSSNFVKLEVQYVNGIMKCITGGQIYPKNIVMFTTLIYAGYMKLKQRVLSGINWLFNSTLGQTTIYNYMEGYSSKYSAGIMGNIMDYNIRTGR